jgi:hypothetical protein
VIAALALFAPALALAAPEVRAFHQLGLASFPLGLQYIHERELRFPLWNSDHVLFRDAHLALIGHAEITPAFPRGGPILHFEPIAVWDLTLRLYGTGYFGTFSALIPVDDPAFDGTPAARRELIDAGGRSHGWALRFDARTRLKAKAGPVISVVELEWRQQRTATADGVVPYHWDPTEMLVVPGDGTTRALTNLTFVEWIRPTHPDDVKLWLGPTTIWQYAPETGDSSVRVGPLAVFKVKEGAETPTFVAGALFWARSRFQVEGLPYVVFATQWKR